MMATDEAKISDTGPYALLDATAALYARAEHRLYVEHVVRGRSLTDGKQASLPAWGLTACPFNAIAYTLRGRIEAVQEGQQQKMTTLKDTIAAAEKATQKADREIQNDAATLSL